MAYAGLDTAVYGVERILGRHMTVICVTITTTGSRIWTVRMFVFLWGQHVLRVSGDRRRPRSPSGDGSGRQVVTVVVAVSRALSARRPSARCASASRLLGGGEGSRVGGSEAPTLQISDDENGTTQCLVWRSGDSHVRLCFALQTVSTSTCCFNIFI